MCELTYMLIFYCIQWDVPWLRRSGLLTFFSSLVIQESLINYANERLRSRIFSHCENILSFCLSASHPWSWVRLRRNRVHFPNHTHIVSNDACVGLVQWSISERDCSHPVFSWVRTRSFRVPFRQLSARPYRTLALISVKGRKLITRPHILEVELGLTGLTSTSWYVRTTRYESLSAYQSSGSVLSVRPRIL